MIGGIVIAITSGTGAAGIDITGTAITPHIAGIAITTTAVMTAMTVDSGSASP
jgi:hypothetical protein